MELWQAGVILAATIGGMWLCYKVDVATKDWSGDKTSWATMILVGISCGVVASAMMDLLPQ